MKTIREQIAVMQHFADGGKVEMQYADGTWKLNESPQWECQSEALGELFYLATMG